MFKKNIYLDFDCVLLDSNRVVLDVIKKVYGEELRYEDLSYFGILPEKYPESLKVYTDVSLYAQAELFDGAVEFVERLMRFGKVKILTHTLSPEIEEYKDVLVSTHFFGLETIHAEEKHLHAEKGAILIDDAVHNVTDFVKDGSRKAILFDKDGEYGWNKESVENSSSIIRATSYDEVLQFLR